MTVDSRKIRLIMELRREGITDTRVLSALERIPREKFVHPSFLDRAYEDTALPIACGQTISQPYVVAYMLQELEIGPRMKVLEIGTGSGYQTAVLSKLCRRVYSIEYEADLLRQGERALNDLHVHNYTAKAGDGWQGWSEQAPFERIIVSAAATEIPEKLLEQLAPTGRMVLPVGETADRQRLVLVEKNAEGLVSQRTLLPVRFVPLVKGREPRRNMHPFGLQATSGE